jgi:hypothetical protein
VASSSHKGASISERQSRTSLRQSISGGIPRPPTPSEGALARPPTFGSTHLHPSQISSGCTTPRSRRSSKRSSKRSSQRTTPLTTQQLPLAPPEAIEVEEPEAQTAPQETIEVDVPNTQELNQYWGTLIEHPLTRANRDLLDPNPLASAGQGQSERVEPVDREGTWTPEDLERLAQEQSLTTLSLRTNQRPRINFNSGTQRILTPQPTLPPSYQPWNKSMQNTHNSRNKIELT